jgi:hypothetical protein
LGVRNGVDCILEIRFPVEAGCCASLHSFAVHIQVITLAVIREAVGQQKIEHLVFPRRGRGVEGLLEERLPI